MMTPTEDLLRENSAGSAEVAAMLSSVSCKQELTFTAWPVHTWVQEGGRVTLQFRGTQQGRGRWGGAHPAQDMSLKPFYFPNPVQHR